MIIHVVIEFETDTDSFYKNKTFEEIKIMLEKESKENDYKLIDVKEPANKTGGAPE